MAKDPIDQPTGNEEEIPDFGEWFPLAERKELVAVYTGTHDGSFGQVHDFVTQDGERVSLPGWTMLSRKLTGLEGHLIRVAYRGELEPGKRGRQGAKSVGVYDRGTA